MAQEHPVVQAIRRQLAHNEKERAFLEGALADAIRFYASNDDSAPGVVADRAVERTAPNEPNERREHRWGQEAPNGKRVIATQGVMRFAIPKFGPAPGGPTETMLAIIRERPGITIGELLDEGVRRVKTSAADPRRSLNETVRALRNHKKIERREDRYYPVT